MEVVRRSSSKVIRNNLYSMIFNLVGTELGTPSIQPE